MSPWSWYMQMMAANSPWWWRQNRVSAGKGPSTARPAAWASLTAGMMILLFFVAEHAVFAGVGVEGRHPQRHAGQPEVPVQGPGGEVEKPHQACLGDSLRHFGQGAVDGGQDHPELTPGQHHGKLGGLGLLRQKLGVARIVVPRELHGDLADGGGDQAPHLVRQGQINGREDVADHGRAGCRSGAAVLKVCGAPAGTGA